MSFTKTFKIGADRSKGELEADPRFKYDPNFMRSEVLPAFLNRVLDALQPLMVEGIDYSCTQEALEDIQAENSHLFQFCQDAGLKYDPNGILTAIQIWERLEQWYLDNGTLTYEESTSSKQKAVWAEQANRSDRNVRAANQVLGRFQQLFPKVKRVIVPHPNDGKKRVAALQGIGFTEVEVTPPTPILGEPTPIPPQSPPQKTTENQGFHPTHPNFLTSTKKTENQNIVSSNVDSEEIENQSIVSSSVDSNVVQNSDTSPELGWVGCDDAKSSLPGVGDWGGTGVETAKTGVGEVPSEAIAPTKSLATDPDTSDRCDEFFDLADNQESSLPPHDHDHDQSKVEDSDENASHPSHPAPISVSSVTNPSPDPSQPGKKSIEDIWIEHHETFPYPNPSSNNPQSSKKRALAIRAAYQSACCKEELSALKRDNGGEYSKEELRWVATWLKKSFPSEHKAMLEKAGVCQPTLFNPDAET